MKVSEICKIVNDCDRLHDILRQKEHISFTRPSWENESSTLSIMKYPISEAYIYLPVSRSL